ncbi:hypothetical protein [Paenibacillus ihbetae]|uniref:Uncharacterized protein n=1 Tax=Paenibacillus ihbetae TaxID=1870820 RepID=A0ABX3JT58_9BACL|nr:hypothetical protein [Paenibacillus ihbetae]OOC58719.1 hypothetical protein BBD40_23840 [Paenibacillus ihbetae]
MLSNLRKSILVLLIITLFMQFSTVSAGPTNLIDTEDKFLEEIRKNSIFKDYQHLLISENPYLIKETTDINNKPSGYIAQFEIEYKYDEQGPAKLTSLLTFVYNKTSKQINALIIDYSRVMETDEVYAVDLTTNDEEFIYSVKESAFMQEMKNDLNKKVDEAEKSTDLSPQATEYCWVCTKKETYGGNLEGDCAFILGSACSLVKQRFLQVICNGGVYVGCYVPKYTICVEGFWSQQCAMPWSA